MAYNRNKMSMAQYNLLKDSEGKINGKTLKQLQNEGLVAGLREKESYRLKGLTDDVKITASFPSAKVTYAGDATYDNLNQNNQGKVDVWKDELNKRMRPIYEQLRSELCEKVMVQS